jgi:hypothetical protein
LLVGSILVASCGYGAPFRSSGAATSKAGVEVRLAGQRCYVNRSAEQFPTAADDDRLHVDVSLQIVNASPKPAQVSLNRFALVEGEPAGSVIMQPNEADVLSLSPNETRSVGLEFEKQTSLDCRHDFSLAANDAIALDGTHVEIGPIGFRPTR